MRRQGVETVLVGGVGVWVVRVVFSGWVVGDVALLIFEVMVIANAVFVVTGVPDLARELLANCKGEPPFIS
jgi:hypothetical protein